MQTYMASQNENGYYLAASGNQFWVDAETGEWERYAVVDVEGEEKAMLTVEKLLSLFHRSSGKEFSSDRAILN